MPILGYEGCYSVSDSGLVRSESRPRKTKAGGVHTIRTRIRKQTPTNQGGSYYRVSLWLNSKSKFAFVHRLVAQAFIPNPLNLPHVNHKNGVSMDNRAENLEWVTPAQNSAHASSTGLTIRGSAHYRAKLDESDIAPIRLSNKPVSELAKCYGVGISTIYRIRDNAQWRHVAA